MAGRRAIVDATSSYLRRHPEELARAIRNAIGLRVGVPLAGLRWLAGRGGAKGPQDVTVDSEPPGIRVAATVDLMKTTVRAATTIFVERVDLSENQMKLELRLERTTMEVLDEGDTAVAALIMSGALDLTKAGSLAAHLPEVKALMSESHENHLVIDLNKHPSLGGNGMVRRLVGLLTSFVTVHGVESDSGHVDVALRALPNGVRGAARGLRKHLLAPARPWIRGMLTGR